ncbi:branched-chain amino acid aminotransferase [Salibacteraceae bacterium]|jgi:branched-chain amino acid aminotransferase|nr:branched-chain amino acid aminotransferase [Salibacteraceae bacterium]
MAVDQLSIRIRKVKNSRLSQVDWDNLQFGRLFSDHMFMADYIDGAWTNLQVLPYGDIPLSPATSSIHYGQSIFEGMKAYQNDEGEIYLFRPEMNHKRFNKSAERMCMAQIPEEVFMSGVKKLIELDKDWIPKDDDSSMYIRPFMFATDNFIGVKPSETYRFMIITSPSGAYYNKPLNVKVETEYVRAAVGGTGAAKAAGNYAGSLYPAKLAREQGYDQLIWTDAKHHRHIEEAGTMNIMFVIDGKLITPSLSGSILPGVTRDSVLKLTKDWDIDVEERPVEVAEVIRAIELGTLSEAFGVGTAATIAQIKSISCHDIDYTLSDPAGREVSNRLQNHLNQLKRAKIEDKFKWLYKVV